ncbi:MAG: restriction endonuclease [Acidimicrobiales bacterium]
MARRRSGLAATVVQVQKDIERQQREQAKRQAAAARAREAALRANERAAKAAERERAQLYAAARADETEALQAELDAVLVDLTTVLAQSLAIDDHFDLSQLKELFQPPPFNPGALALPAPPPDARSYTPAAPTGIGKLLPGARARHEQRTNDARQQFELDRARWEESENHRLQRLQTLQGQYNAWHETERLRVAAQHAEIDRFVAALQDASVDAVTTCFEMVLDGSVWPDGFPQSFVLAYDAGSRLLGVDYTLPSMDVIPSVKSYKYVKTRDEITSVELPAAQRRSIYMQVITQSALRILHEVFEADRTGIVETMALNCFVNTIDPATGQPIQPCLLSVRTSRDSFVALNLRQVDPVACLRALAAAVSASPAEMAPVRPVIELRMIDPRFVAEQDVLSELDARPNLMELSPYEFESLITSLFMKMGLESRQTQPSRDGGVDCVAYDPRPIFGGKVVIQAKRYSSTVEVAAVRDLYGTVQNEGASKGILVTTSGYGKSAYEFAKGKPLELLSGANLLHLLEEHAGVQAKIIIPARQTTQTERTSPVGSAQCSGRARDEPAAPSFPPAEQRSRVKSGMTTRTCSTRAAALRDDNPEGAERGFRRAPRTPRWGARRRHSPW